MGCAGSKKAGGAPPPIRKAVLTREEAVQKVLEEGQELCEDAARNREEVMAMLDANGVLRRQHGFGYPYNATEAGTDHGHDDVTTCAPTSTMTVNDLSVAIPIDPGSCIMFLPQDYMEHAGEQEIIAEGWAVKSTSICHPADSP